MIPLTEAQVQAVVDSLFKFLETKEGPGLKLATEIVQGAVDGDLPALYTWLQSKGVMTP